MKFKLSNFLVLPLLGASCVYAADNIPPNTSPVHKGSIERAETKQATALLDRAVDFLQENGPENSFGVFSNRQGPFVSNEYYVFVVGLDGIMYASGGASNSLIGSNVLNLSDASGINIIRDMLDIAKTSESGAIEYHWLNSVDNRIENTTTQFRKVGKYLVCVGYYIHRASLEEATVMLHRAVAFLKKSGGKTAFAAFNDPASGFVIKDEYVFAIGLDDGKYRASGAAPYLTGTDVRELTDAAGKPIFKKMIELAKQNDGGTIDYVWRNPATNAIENKHTLIQRVGDVLLGVGYYTKD
ncbi:cache domain-containing protein [Sideroxydans sp. CL21]|uniref:cache domain-containing protein n=1 Tax=Sideroxydans sp. CL21 TaxID=2600596 RepID=UPI0024BC1200|nr:cache domain-containing protein [Sideroxydans sp. CL21]